MKKAALLLSTFILVQHFCFSQGMQPYKGKTFIFDAYEQAQECDALGGNIGATIIVLKGALFTVERVPNATHLVIKFRKYNDATKRSAFNFKTSAAGTQEVAFFLLPKAVFDASCSEYKYEQRWDINFGALTTPFKFRSSPFLFTTNLNLGTAVSWQRKFFKNWTIGLVGGLSLSSVALDSFSTKGTVSSVTERPAVTPSFHGMIGYKNINLTLGIGWDFINRPTGIEESWIYHGKSWIGIGLGVSLFNANNNASTTKPQDQD